MEQLIKYAVGEMQVIVQAPATFMAAILVITAFIWAAMNWRYGGIVAHRESDLQAAQTQRDFYKVKLEEAERTMAEGKPKGILAKEPLEFASEKDAFIAPISPNRFSVMFRSPMRATPTLKFVEPDTHALKLDVKLEYWSPMGFTVEFPAGTPLKQLRFTADARRFN